MTGGPEHLFETQEQWIASSSPGDALLASYGEERRAQQQVERHYPRQMAGLPEAALGANVKVPTRRTIYEEPALWIVGWTMPTYWRSMVITRGCTPSSSRSRMKRSKRKLSGAMRRQ